MPAETEPPWMATWLGFVRTHSRLWDQVEAQMRKDHGLTMARYDVLATLINAGGRLRLSDLASSILLSQSGVSKLLDRMERSGLVHRDPDPSDGRAAFAAITSAGRSLAEEARLEHHELLQRMFGNALEPKDLNDLDRIMARLRTALP